MPALLRPFRSAVAALALASLSIAPAAAAPVLSITGSQHAWLGSTFTLDVVASDVDDLYGYQFDVVFDPAVFRANSVGEGGFLASAGTTFFDGGMIDNVLGTISFVLDTLIGDGPGVSGAGLLASLSFTSVGTEAGSGRFELANVIALNSSVAEFEVGTRSLSVSVIPEPATWALAGVAMLAACRRRRRSVAAGGRLAAA